MKIAFLLAQCTPQYLKDSTAIIIKVLKELDVEIELIELNKLPYFNGKKTKEMDKVVEMVHSSKGVIAVTNVPMLSVHGAMQTFFDCATVYDAEKFDKPILAITYSEWLGEVEAAEKILKNWSIIGGTEGYKICLNKGSDFNYISNRLERMAEDFYRLIKQSRPNISSTERQIYHYLKTGEAAHFFASSPENVPLVNKVKEDEVSAAPEIQVKNFVDILKEGSRVEKPKEVVAKPLIDLSTKEQTIKEIASLLKKQVSEEEIDAPKEAFTAISSGIYKKPSVHANAQITVKRLQQIPHYFVAKHDKALQLVLKYTITNSNEQGFIIIRNGDCEYIDDTSLAPTVELMLSDEVLNEILTKKITYQKAFMLGKLKVKGNFAILPKLDQAFTGVK